MMTREKNRPKSNLRCYIAYGLALVLMACVLSGMVSVKSYAAPTEITVHDGATTNSYVPFYGFYADAYLKAHFIYPSSELAGMDGGTISELKFYTNEDKTWTGTVEVYFKEVGSTTLSAFDDLSGATLVYSGSLAVTGNVMTITLTTPYVYQGGNLLVAIHNVVTGNYQSASFYGETVSGAAVQGYSYTDIAIISPTQKDFLPKTTFTYELPSAGNQDSWVEPIYAKIKNAGQMTLALGEAQTVSIEGDFALPYDIMRELAAYPDVTLNYKVTYEGNTYDLAIPGSNVQADASIPWYGPAWLIANYAGNATDQQTAESQNGTYVVQHGEYVNMIAAKLGVDPKAIIRLNGLKNPNLIHPGQILKY